MYEQYFGFVEKPFSLTPDPRYLYLSPAHADALELLEYAIDRREGFTVITGEIGTGKTTLGRALLARMSPRTCVSLLLNPFLSEDDLLLSILRDFGVLSRDYRPWPGCVPARQDMIDVLHRFLLSLAALGGRAVVLVDEAQNLPLHVLEQMRLLSNLETHSEKLLQMVLLGQRNLASLLDSPDLRQLDQRISIRYELRPLSDAGEVTSYIAHRLAIAQGTRTVVFPPPALARVYDYSGGIPRIINLLCDRALIVAYGSSGNVVTADHVVAAAHDLQLRAVRPPPKPRSWFGRVQQTFGREVYASAVR